MTNNQRAKNRIVKIKNYRRKLALMKCPQKRAHVIRLVIRSPKKPHSARRKTARVLLTHKRKAVNAYTPSSGHNIQKFSVVLVEGGRRRDIPGIVLTLIRGARPGKYSYGPPAFRRSSLSKYGLKKIR